MAIPKKTAAKDTTSAAAKKSAAKAEENKGEHYGTPLPADKDDTVEKPDFEKYAEEGR